MNSNLSETITGVIEHIQQNQCVGCKFGKALISLKDLRDSMEPQGGGNA